MQHRLHTMQPDRDDTHQSFKAPVNCLFVCPCRSTIRSAVQAKCIPARSAATSAKARPVRSEDAQGLPPGVHTRPGIPTRRAPIPPSSFYHQPLPLHHDHCSPQLAL